VGVGTRVLRLLRRALLTGHTCGRGVDALEPRALLANTALPTLADLESPNNTVVRLETNFGDVDIELFNGQAPISVANFMNYLRTGRFDETFFHRRSSQADSGVTVLQGGGFAYSDDGGVTVVSTDAPIVRETTGRSNVARTLAMARTGQINSATNQFYFNLTDNTNLDPTGPSNGFTVFGRVIQGWSVVQTIQGLVVEDLSGDPALSEIASAVNTVPVTAAYNPTSGVREAALVRVINAEEIKPSEVAGFFDQRLVMPEGFRSSTTTETVEIFNPNTVAVRYQLIARYETGGADGGFQPGGRDSVVSRGTLAPGEKLRVTLSSTATGATPLVRDRDPYTMILESAVPDSVATPLPIAASIVREDFLSSTSEAFINPAALSTQQAREWAFPRIERNALSQEFLLLYNTTDTVATVTIDVVTPEGNRTITRVVDPYRRSGVALAGEGLPEGVLAARVRSTQNIVAVLSDWDTTDPAATIPPGSSIITPGTLVTGFAGGGATIGAIARAQKFADQRSEISFYNSSTTSTSVTLRIQRTDGTVVSSSTLVLAGSRVGVPVDFTLLDDESVTIVYDSGVTPIAAQYSVLPITGRNAAGNPADGASTMFAPVGGVSATFAEGGFDPSIAGPGFAETVSIYNPMADGSLDFTVRYNFSDGDSLIGATGTLVNRRRADVQTTSLTNVLAKINSGTQFRTYAIVVTGLVRPTAGAQFDFAGIVALTRDDARTQGTGVPFGRSIVSSGFLGGPTQALTSTGVFGTP
jgi:peptidyl-prolyl cis-trans isomerase A (cyclophilin A)